MKEEREVIIKLGMFTPYWPLSMAYGMFFDHETSMWFLSLDHYIGYQMFKSSEHRKEVVTSPNGWIALQNTKRILAQCGTHAVRDDWIDGYRDTAMSRGLRLKIDQNTCIREMLRNTRRRRLIDNSRIDETYWCNADGRGANRHAELLTEVRSLVHKGVPLSSVQPLSEGSA